MRKLYIRQFRKNMSKELKELPFILVKRNKPIAKIIPLTREEIREIKEGMVS